MKKALSFLAPLLVVIVAVVVGASDGGGPTSDAERSQAIAGSVRCPTCRGQSVASSDAPAAEQIRAEIDRRVARGESDDDVRAALVASYGDSVLLNPPGTGVAGLVWALPVAAVVVALAGLVLALRRWRSPPVAPPTDEDRRLVAEARADARPPERGDR